MFIASGLSFDSLPRLRSFLDSSPAASEAIGGLVKIRGVRFDDGLGDEASPPQPGDLYHVLLGLAKLITPLHVGNKKQSNVALQLDLAQGANDGLLKVIVATRNKCGVAAGSPLVIDYGMEYDHDIVAEQVAATGRDPKRLKGLLDKYFTKLGERVPDGGSSPGTSQGLSPVKPPPGASQGSVEEAPSPNLKRCLPPASPADTPPTKRAHSDGADGEAQGSLVHTQASAGATPTHDERLEPKEPEAQAVTPKPEKNAVAETETSEVVIGKADKPFRMCLMWDPEAQKASLVAQEPLSSNKKVPPLTLLAYTNAGKAPFVGAAALAGWWWQWWWW